MKGILDPGGLLDTRLKMITLVVAINPNCMSERHLRKRLRTVLEMRDDAGASENCRKYSVVLCRARSAEGGPIVSTARKRVVPSSLSRPTQLPPATAGHAPIAASYHQP